MKDINNVYAGFIRTKIKDDRSINATQLVENFNKNNEVEDDTSKQVENREEGETQDYGNTESRDS